MTYTSPSRLRVIALVMVGAIGMTACGSEDSTRSSGADPDFERGAAVYAESCASCHGGDLRGTDDGPSHLSVVYEPNHHSDDSFRNAIANGASQHHWGFGDMDPVDGLSSADVEAVIAFVRAEQERLGFDQ